MSLDTDSYCNASREWSVRQEADGDLVIQFHGLKNRLVVEAEYEADGLLQYRLVDARRDNES
jgi:plastocyanin domain-containing protein